MVLQKLIQVVQKNFRLLLRSRTSALIIVLGPLILISLIGLAFSNTEPYGITIATYSSSYNALTESIVEKMDEQRFAVERVKSEDACIRRVKQAKANVCLVFPPGFAFGDVTANNITFHVDYAKVNLVWNVLEVISEKVTSRSTEISQDLTGELVNTITHTKNAIDTQLPVVVDLSVKNSQLVTLSTDIARIVTNMDFNLSPEDFQVDLLEKRVALVTETGQSAANRGISLITHIRENYEELNISESQRLTLEQAFDDAEDDLDDLQRALNDLYVAGNASSLLGDIINDLDDNLLSAKAELITTSNSRGIVNDDIENLHTLLQQSLDKIDDLQIALERLKAEIDAIAITDPTQIISPISTTIKPLTVDTHFNYLFPSLIVLIIMITGVLLSSMLVIVEKKSKAFFRNFVTPTSEFTFIFGTFVTALMVMAIQLVIFLLIAGIFFSTNIWATFTTTGPILLVVTILFIFLGMLVGTLFYSEETTTLAAISVSSLLLFLSSTILPLESMPFWIQWIARFNPFVLSESVLKQTLFFEFGFDLLAGQLFLLSFYAVILFISIVWLHHVLRIRALYKIHKEPKQRKRMIERLGLSPAKSWKDWVHFGKIGKKEQSLSDHSGALPELKEHRLHWKFWEK